VLPPLRFNAKIATVTLLSSLTYAPVVLKFGTSGRRGEIIHLTPLEIYLNIRAEIEYLLALPAADGGITRGDDFYFAIDLRPSSPTLAVAAVEALRDTGMNPVHCGAIPTPALTYFALQHHKGSLMVTGSHIPFNRNGYKLNTAVGELLKHHEGPINTQVAKVREELYSQAAEESKFNPQGQFKTAPAPLPSPTTEAAEAYLDRYTTFFAGKSLNGRKVLVYQHSSVGRDLLVDLLIRLGAQVTPAGRSDVFVPIDTENIEAAQYDINVRRAAYSPKLDFRARQGKMGTKDPLDSRDSEPEAVAAMKPKVVPAQKPRKPKAKKKGEKSELWDV